MTFYTAFKAYKTIGLRVVLEITGPNADPANRAGELWSRTDVIEHVFTDHFKKAWLLGHIVQRPVPAGNALSAATDRQRIARHAWYDRYDHRAWRPDRFKLSC